MFLTRYNFDVLIITTADGSSYEAAAVPLTASSRHVVSQKLRSQTVENGSVRRSSNHQSCYDTEELDI
ncbi:unnamed protein product [Hymenolepis diminuta]|uniref:DUF2483 domain-containing protein n=1 Tax=Hymenolepis diminuta TaxID=6216 RepID=A0A0R3SJR5_HYMDI|nr:unnamed protein product [Hymenolepis diminuta]